MTPQTVLDFWFAEENQPFWFQKSDDFDQAVRSRFAGLLAQAAQSELYRWRDSLHGRLAEIIVLDQFPRNLHRNSPAAFAHDNMAVALAQEAVRQSGFADMAERERHFMLMPLMHSESRIVHQQAEALFKQYTSDYAYQFELKHKVIIDRFGRYPHRNAVLGRPSSAEEIEFLKQPDSSF
ncbi:DUF924 family protein [Kingella pumchi]|jgi:spoVR like family protein|uniref:DUF924 domain-containing protein n=1 Tax=Kingella pumchi TaxID=2779506 RepID=A0ABS9NKU6_9NEIS|nr:DUF924 family protein [Kingella pumchi]MCG6503409.1 DUF924 domain-containing protein [Kingella pumchi]